MAVQPAVGTCGPRQMWMNTSQSREQLAADLAAWCHRAEASGIAALREFSIRLRAARA